MVKKNSPAKTPLRLIASLAVMSVIVVSLLILRIQLSDSSRYIFLTWNLILAIVPALLAWWLVVRVKQHGWLSWKQIGLTLLWITFLPNSFYLITDLVHLRVNYEADIFFDISLLTGFILAGLVYGYIGVYLIHNELNKRMRESQAYGLTTVLFLAVSFAICLGRYTRWNTWDIILRPAGLLFDVSDRFINPQMHGQTYQTTIVLFLIIFSLYAVIYEIIRLLKRS